MVIFCCWKNAYIYLFSLFYKRHGATSRFFLPKNCLFLFLEKTYFCESKNIGVQKVRKSFRCTQSKSTGCRILGEERNQIFLPVQWGVFSLRIAFIRFNPGYIFLPLIYFFLVFIVCYNALFMCCQLNLFCYYYFVI